MLRVAYINHMGNDDSVVNAARVSFAKRAEQYPPEQNHRLIRYLAKHGHEIPFAHTAITLRIRAPIAIRTQCFKSKIGFVESEISRRYVTETPELFIPTFREKAVSVKQGSSDSVHIDNNLLQTQYEVFCKSAIAQYECMVKQGVPPEQARFILPQGVMTEWVWTGSLLAFARFYKLRSDQHAQKEIRDLAEMVRDVIEPLFPVSWAALMKGKSNE